MAAGSPSLAYAAAARNRRCSSSALRGAGPTAHPWSDYAEHPTWSPNSRWILFDLSPEGTIQAIRPNGRRLKTILPAVEGRGGHKPWYSPDGSRILFVCENRGLLPEPPTNYNEDLCIMDADGSDIVKLTNTRDTLENWPSWGPAPRRR